MPEAFLVGGVRTPNGRYGGALRDTSAVALGALAGTAALARAGVPAEAVDEVILANCRQAGNGPNPGRQVAIRAGVPERTPAQTVNMACASGLKVVALGHQAVTSGAAEVVLAVAAESMSTMPYLAPASLRWSGVRRGDVTLIDGWRDGGTDPVCGMSMGQTAERLAREHGIGREEQDRWSLRSHQRARRAWETGRFAAEVVPVPCDGGGLGMDETVRPDTDAEQLARLRPAFAAGGTVTAGNSSPMADGAAAVVVASAAAVERHGLRPAGRLRAFAAVGVDPRVMGIGPARAIPAALRRAGLELPDIDVFEINEAFAAQIVHNVRTLGLADDVVNVNGGGIALGHPTGQSGCRLVVTLLEELAGRDGRLGVVSLCVGGGQGVAAVIERVA